LELADFDAALAAPWLAGKAELATQLGLLPRFVSCTAWAARRPNQRTAIRSDNRDLFIVQLSGRQRCRIGPNDAEHPLTALQPRRAGRSMALRPGSAWSLPRSFWHEAEVTGEPSLALAIAAWRPSWLELLGVALHNPLGASARWREPIDAAWGTPEQRIAA